MAANYINSNNPVYISYSWSNEANPDIEDDVKALCALMEENGIFYKLDKAQDEEHSLIGYGDVIQNAEYEIAKGNAIIVVFSPKYFKSPHCLHELHCIINNPHFERRVYPIWLPTLTKEVSVYDMLASIEHVKIEIERERRKGKVMGSVENFFLENCRNGQFVSDFERLGMYIKDYNIPDHCMVTSDNYSAVIKKLKRHFEMVASGQIEEVIPTGTQSQSPNPANGQMPVQPPQPPVQKLAQQPPAYDKSDSMTFGGGKIVVMKPLTIIIFLIFFLTGITICGVVFFTDTVNRVIESESYTRVFTVNGVSFKMMKVEGGTFYMGMEGSNVKQLLDAEPEHVVSISKDFYIGVTEVTNRLWYAVMGSLPQGCSGSGNYPVYNVSQFEALAFVAKISQITGQRYRLPTEAEWEYAARGGMYSGHYLYSGGDTISKVAWQDGYIHDVAQKRPNELGLYDMTGNVWEWCSDWYKAGYYAESPKLDPICNSKGPLGHVVKRGGSSEDSDLAMCTFYRNHGLPGEIKTFNGLRLVLEE